MSIALFPGPVEDEKEQTDWRVTERRSARSIVRRRGTLVQGHALESLGHAVEYLVDSRMWQRGEFDEKSHDEAVQVLMQLSRAVFAECPEVVPFGQRFRDWVNDRVSGLGR
jgi:hypothetical protein